MSQFRQRSTGICAFALPVLMLIYSTGLSSAQPAASATSEPPLDYAVQGWSAADRDTFYTTSQGSHMMPARVVPGASPSRRGRALRRRPAAALRLSSQCQPGNTRNLPVGFVIDTGATPAQLGMTCAACHTGQLEYQKNGITHALRLDGAPANADFQQFLLDLTAAAARPWISPPASTLSPRRSSAPAILRQAPPASRPISAPGCGSSAISWTRACRRRLGGPAGLTPSA